MVVFVVISLGRVVAFVVPVPDEDTKRKLVPKLVNQWV